MVRFEPPAARAAAGKVEPNEFTAAVPTLFLKG
jgi:hypothetical protein